MIYLLGGCVGFLDDVKRSFQKNIKGGKILFAPSSPKNIDQTKHYAQLTLEWFQVIGIEFSQVEILSLKMTEDSLVDSFKDADVIYLMGGAPLIQKKYFKDLQIQKYLNASLQIIIGNSAGALNLCDTAILLKNKDVESSCVYKGLNLTKELNVHVHYLEHEEDEIELLMKKNNIASLIAIPENEGLLLHESLEILGKGLVKFELTKKAVLL